jgi:lipopolysaccharide/colanic/teichoic acid biosynthesis glycosyltransferase
VVGAARSGLRKTWAQQDLSYIDRWSLWRILEILARTLACRIEGAAAPE